MLCVCFQSNSEKFCEFADGDHSRNETEQEFQWLLKARQRDVRAHHGCLISSCDSIQSGNPSHQKHLWSEGLIETKHLYCNYCGLQ